MQPEERQKPYFYGVPDVRERRAALGAS